MKPEQKAESERYIQAFQECVRTVKLETITEKIDSLVETIKKMDDSTVREACLTNLRISVPTLYHCAQVNFLSDFAKDGKAMLREVEGVRGIMNAQDWTR